MCSIKSFINPGRGTKICVQDQGKQAGKTIFGKTRNKQSEKKKTERALENPSYSKNVYIILKTTHFLQAINKCLRESPVKFPVVHNPSLLV